VVAALALSWGGIAGAQSTESSGDRQARREQWCKDNPEKCRELQAKAKARQEECKANPEKCRAEVQARQEDRFKAADANKDGKLTREEAQKGMPAVARNFDQIDANKDGAVTPQELEAARTARAAARAEKGK
jgi:hypothetical protein